MYTDESKHVRPDRGLTYYHRSNQEFVLGAPPQRIGVPLPQMKGSSEVEDDGCLSIASYDVHAVYVSTCLWESSDLWFHAYEVRPEGRMWSDPEWRQWRIGEDHPTPWCCDQATVVRIIR